MKSPFLSVHDKHWREVLEKSFTAFVMKALGAGLGFAFNVLLARMLGADGAGVFFLALTVTTIASVFGRIGLDNTLVRFTAGNAGVGNWAAVKGIYRKGMLLAATASTVAALAMFFSVPWLAEKVFDKPELMAPMRWMALAVVPLSLQILHGEMLKGLKRIMASALVYDHGLSISALSILGLYFMGPVWGATGAVWAFVFASLVTLGMGYWLWRAATPQLRAVDGQFAIQSIFQSSLPLFWVMLMNLVMNWTASFILGVWGTKSDVGIFNVAARTAQVTSFILIAVNSIAAPKFAELYNQGNKAALGRLARRSTWLMTLVASPALLLLVLFPGRIMALFGRPFEAGAAVLAILSIGQFVNVVTGSVGYLLMMSGNEYLVRNNITFAALLNLVLNLVLIPYYGVLGAALATAISLAVKNLLAAYLVWNRLNIQTIPLMGRINTRQCN